MPETEYIDRKSLLKSLFSDEPAAMEDYYYNAISSFQSSDVAPVIHAKWIHDGQRVKGGVDWYHCSNCLSPESGVYVHRPYCSWCGAKMDLDIEENNR